MGCVLSLRNGSIVSIEAPFATWRPEDGYGGDSHHTLPPTVTSCILGPSTSTELPAQCISVLPVLATMPISNPKTHKDWLTHIAMTVLGGPSSPKFTEKTRPLGLGLEELLQTTVVLIGDELAREVGDDDKEVYHYMNLSMGDDTPAKLGMSTDSLRARGDGYATYAPSGPVVALMCVIRPLRPYTPVPPRC